MLRSSLTLLLLFSFTLGFSQSDSLLDLLKKDKADSNKVKHLNELSWQIKDNDPDSAILLSLRALELCKEIETTDKKVWESLKADCYSNIGIGYYFKSDYNRALENLYMAVKLYEGTGNKKRTSSIFSNIGAVYYQVLDLSKALEYYEKAYKICESIKDTSGMASLTGNIAGVYYAKKNNHKAIEYYQQALKLSRILHKKAFEANTLNGLGLSYLDRGELQKAMEYFQGSLALYNELGNMNQVAYTYGNLGQLHISSGNYHEAFRYLYRALALDDSIGLPEGVKEDYRQLSDLYERSTVALADTPGGKLLNAEQMRLRSLFFFKHYIAIKDTLLDEEAKEALFQEELNFEFEKKMSAAKAEQDKKDALAEAENRKKVIVIILVSIVLILVIIFAVYVFRTLRETRLQKKMIEEKQREIVDSITYARRIQSSLLPTDRYLDKNIERLKK
jgi:tetratricopeptide (TPR) repeat protein